MPSNFFKSRISILLVLAYLFTVSIEPVIAADSLKKPVIDEKQRELTLGKDILDSFSANSNPASASGAAPQKFTTQSNYTDYVFGENVPDPLSNASGFKGDYDTQLSTGSATYGYEMELPPGRNGLSPSLSLQYLSQSSQKDSLVGYGWDISESYIERSDRKGVDTLYTNNEFKLVLSGIGSEISPTALMDEQKGYGEYAEVVSQYFWKYTFLSDNSWTLTDKSGTKYFFGRTEWSRMFDSSNTAKIYRWYLEEVRDTNENFIRYEYIKDENRVYPKKIVYTGHGENVPTNDGPFRIEFVLKERTDPTVSYRPGFRVTTRYIIDEIQVYIDEFAITDPVRIYDFEYETGDNGKRSLLQKITETGTGEDGERKTLPPTTFEYHKNETSQLDWKTEAITYPTSLNCSSDTVILDANRDGYDDILRSYLYHQNSTDPFQSFSYAYINKKNGTFEDQSSTYALPEPLSTYESYQVIDSNVFNFFDFNGDLPTDIGEGEAFTNNALSSDEHVYFLKENGWQKGSGYNAIEGWMQYSSSVSDLGTRNFDVNGDGLTDLTRGYQKTTGAFESALSLNDPEIKDFTPSTTYRNDFFPFAHEGSYGNYDPGFRLADVNGDGLTDVVYSFYEMNNIFDAADTVKYSKVYLNNGSNGWVEDPAWTVPVAIAYTFQTDINSECGNDPENTWFNLLPQSRYYTGAYFLDVNGDKLQDIIVGNDSGKTIELYCSNRSLRVESNLQGYALYLNNGVNGWTQVTGDFQIPTFVYYDSYYDPIYDTVSVSFQYDKRIHIAEINGDGLADMASNSGSCPTGGTINGSYFASEARADSDLLHFVRNSYGGSVELSYESSSQHKDAAGTYLNPELPITLQVVKDVKLNDGVGNIHTIKYEYQNGKFFTYSSFIREFAGFETVTSDDSVILNRTTFSQGTPNNEVPDGTTLSPYYSLKGKPLRTEILNRDGSKLSETIQKWEAYDFGGGRSFPKLTQEVTVSYEGGATYRGTASTFTYDNATGNLIEKRNYGEVVYDTGNFTDIGSDAVFTVTKYADNTSVWIFGLPTEETITDASGTKKVQTRYYYDGSKSIGQVSKGNLTKIARWIDTDNAYIFTQFQYDVYGNKTRVARSNRIEEDDEAFDHATHYEYDTALHMYPDRIINPEGHEILFRYDLFTGSAKKVIDPNQTTFEYEYDPFYRLKRVRVNDPENYAVLKTKTEYSYDDSSVPTSIGIQTYDGVSDDPVSTYAYFDGFRRTVQTRVEAENGQYTVSDVQYNELDQITRESLKYFDSGSSYRAPSWNIAHTAFEYDALSRPKKVSFIKSTLDTYAVTSYDYSTPWQTIITDPESHSKKLRYDAFGRLTEVDEYLIGLWYTTRYSYDTVGNLIKIVDSKGNERSLRYDSLSRLIETTETHTPSDTNISVWHFSYDDNNNLVTHTDPNGNVMTFTYDMIDRTKSETSSTENVSYEYDTSIGGIGRLASVTTGTSFTGYQYDDLGNLRHETKIVLDTEFMTSFQTDILGRVRSITYPETTRIDYLYNEAGTLESVEKFGVEGSQILVSNIDYSPLGQIVRLDYGDGTSALQEFPMDEMYRLKHKTIKRGSFSIQDLEYSYDRVGNLLSITDRSDTDTEKIATYEYDDLYRLTRANADYGDIDRDGQGSHSSDYDETYEYDTIGNMTYKFGIGNFTYNGPNAHAPSNAGDYSLTYDNNGNLLSDGLRRLTYNSRNEMVQTQYNNVLTYLGYDNTGQRVIKETSTSRTYYPNKYYELYQDGTGLKSLAHIYAGNLRIAFIEIDSPFDADKDGVKAEDGDCYDYDATIYPGAREVCDDGIDQDCDARDTLCSDLDNDLDGYTPGNGDCNDNDVAIHPRANDTCDDGIDQDCSGYDLPCVNADRDNDHYTSGNGDCKDDDPTIYPTAPELCNGIDDDCDGEIDDGLTFDLDGDGYQSENSCSGSQNDCNDVDKAYHPEASETCSTSDFDCDGSNQSCLDVDDDGDSWTEAEGDCDDANASVHPNNNEIERNGLDDDCDATTLDDDLDQDGYASDFDCNDDDRSIYPYAPEWKFPCEDEIDQDCDGYDLGCDSLDLDADSYSADDCNDQDPSVHPGAIEVAYDGIDNDCDVLTTDDDLDRDDYGIDFDCDDNNRGRWPGNDEICGDGIDQDCDYMDLSCDLLDQDLDGFTPAQGDCNDANASIHPDAEENYYDGIDNDCDPLTVDDDQDRDGYDLDLDCNDDEASINPGAEEICGDRIDQDCNGMERFCFKGFDRSSWPGVFGRIVSDGLKIKPLSSQSHALENQSQTLTKPQSTKTAMPASPNSALTQKTSPTDVTQRLLGIDVRDKADQLHQLKRDTFKKLLDLIFGRTQSAEEKAFSTLESNAKLFYVFSDHLGSTAGVMDSSGNLVNVKDYKPFGSVYVNQSFMSEASDFPYSFIGKEYDEEMGLYYFEARYLHDELGRFTSMDPALFDTQFLSDILNDPQSLNSYSYARNNPLMLKDESGQFWETIWDVGWTIYDTVKTVKNVIETTYYGAQYTYGYVTGNESLQNSAAQQWNQNSQELKQSVVDVAFDAGATALPFVPAGTSRVIKAANKAIDSSQTLQKAEKAVKGWALKADWAEHMLTKKHRLFEIEKNADKLKSIIQLKVSKAAREGKLVEGLNQIKTTLKGKNVELRVYVNEGYIKNINAFSGHASRIFKNSIFME